jgi:AraC family transcriptional regulator, regulatory protein of adaptative response / methylphosphotriester-DNA alkyltransferase methyltransferase
MQEKQWQAIVDCDASYDGTFFYAVATTGIFCRPSCKSRTPKRDNVLIFTHPEEAIAASYRACKRCKPDHQRRPDEDLAHRVIQHIEAHYSEPLTLATLADEFHVSPYHLHHVFKRVTGRTPSDDLLTTRLEQAKTLLTDTEMSITAIAGSVGFPNMAHFSSVFQKYIEMSPTAYRQQARNPLGK